MRVQLKDGSVEEIPDEAAIKIIRARKGVEVDSVPPETNRRYSPSFDKRLNQAVPEALTGPSWEEAIFPRATEGTPGSFAAKLGGDVLSLPFRALATAPAAMGAGEESIGESMRRTGGRSDEPGWMQFFDEALRSPVNAILPGATTAGGMLHKALGSTSKILPSLALRMLPASLAISGGNQARNISEGKPISVSQAAIESAVAQALGMGIPMAGKFAEERISPVLKKLSSAMFTKTVKPTDKAKAAGWNPTHVLEDLSASGTLPWRMGGYKKGFQGLIDDAAQAQQSGMAQDIAAANEAGRPIRVDLNRAAQAGQSKLDEAMQSRRLAGADQFVPSAQSWLSKSTHTTGLKPRDVSLVDLDAALQTRRSMDKFAFVDNAKGVSSARKIGAKGTRQDINSQLDPIAPRTRAADARLARLMPNLEGMGATLDRRLNNYFISPVDIVAGLIAGEHGAAAGVGAGALSRMLRTTIPTTAAWKLALALENAPAAADILAPIALRGFAIDNARGAR